MNKLTKSLFIKLNDNRLEGHADLCDLTTTISELNLADNDNMTCYLSCWNPVYV